MRTILLLLISLSLNGYGQNAKEFSDSTLIKYQNEDYIGAISDFSKAIELDPKDAGAYFSRGSAKLILHDTDGGCLDISKSGELGYELAYIYIQSYCK